MRHEEVKVHRRAAYHYMPLPKDDEEPLRSEVIRMASTYGRYGYRFIAGMMRNVGWGQATTAKVARIWWQEGLRSHKSSLLEVGSGLTMAVVSAYELPTPIMCGVTILSLLEMLMVARSVCPP